MHRLKCPCGRVMYPGSYKCPVCGRPASFFEESIEEVNHHGTDCDCCPKKSVPLVVNTRGKERLGWKYWPTVYYWEAVNTIRAIWRNLWVIPCEVCGAPIDSFAHPSRPCNKE